MPLLPLVLILLAPLVIVLMIPFSLLLRYRAGTARRPGRRWAVLINLGALTLSCGFFVWIAALTNFWAPPAFAYSLLGLLAGAVLGVLGLFLTRWEETPRALHYTPNRWLILFLTAAVALRLAYGLWRAWHAWVTRTADSSWLAAAGVAGSMAVGAVVLGYYLAYTAGIYRRLRRRS